MITLGTASKNSSSLSMTACDDGVEISILRTGITFYLYFMLNARKSSKSPSDWQQLGHCESAIPNMIRSFFFFIASHVGKSRSYLPSLTESVGSSALQPLVCWVYPSTYPSIINEQRYRLFWNLVAIY